MRPLLFKIPIPFTDGIPVFSYGLMLMFGFLTACWLSEWNAKRRDQHPAIMGSIMFVCLICGIVGSRALAVWEKWDTLGQHPLEWFANLGLLGSSESRPSVDVQHNVQRLNGSGREL